MGTHRLFVSVELPADIQNAIAAVQDPFEGLPGVKLVDPSNTHITLAFLGETDADTRPAVDSAIEAAIKTSDVGPIQLEVAGLGVFPDFDYISVIWLGLRTGASDLTMLHDALMAELSSLGVEPEDREYIPHVTIARVSDGRSKSDIQDHLAHTDPSVGQTSIEQLHLMESILTDGGPQYESLESYHL